MAKQKWDEALLYSTPKFIEHEVNGKMQKFYPISIGLMFKIRTAAKEVVKAVSDIFADTKRDNKTIDDRDGTRRTVVIEPIETDKAKFRDNQKANAWANALDAALSPETTSLLAEMIMDSLQEVFGEDRPTPEEFFAKTKTPTFIQMVVGMAKGNVDVLGPLGSRATSVLHKLGEVVSTKLQDVKATSDEISPKANPT